MGKGGACRGNVSVAYNCLSCSCPMKTVGFQNAFLRPCALINCITWREKMQLSGKFLLTIYMGSSLIQLSFINLLMNIHFLLLMSLFGLAYFFSSFFPSFCLSCILFLKDKTFKLFLRWLFTLDFMCENKIEKNIQITGMWISCFLATPDLT